MHLYHDSAFVLSTLFLLFCHVFLRQILKHNLVDIVSFIFVFSHDIHHLSGWESHASHSFLSIPSIWWNLFSIYPFVWSGDIVNRLSVRLSPIFFAPANVFRFFRTFDTLFALFLMHFVVGRVNILVAFEIFNRIQRYFV